LDGIYGLLLSVVVLIVIFGTLFPGRDARGSPQTAVFERGNRFAV
jgi:hypothetical protein